MCVVNTFMNFSMFCATTQNKIFNSIVVNNLIYMMDNFVWFKMPSNVFFYYKSMFISSNISVAQVHELSIGAI